MTDLHTHSTFSDGSFTPTELVGEAVRVGLSAVALCDHNTINGLGEFRRAADKTSLEAVSGIELSTEYGKNELHIVGLFINESACKPLCDILSDVVKRKTESNIDLVDKLKKLGYEISYDEIVSKSSGTINRANIAAELCEKGYSDSVWDIYNELLCDDRGLYVPAKRPDALDMVRLLRELGAVPVLAHPFVSMKPDEVTEFVPKAKKHGLVAMETRYSTFTYEQERLAESIAREFGIEQSGGSDFHGKNKPDIKLGTGRGGLCVPDEFYHRLSDYVK